MTTSIPNQTRLFGMDLSQWPMQWRAAGAMLLGLPALRGLTPPVRVDLLRADGGRSFWDVAHGRAQPAAPGAGAALLAVELPRDQVLDRQFTLPRLTPADVARAVRLEVDAATPFDPEQTVFGYAATPTGDTLRIDLAIMFSWRQLAKAKNSASCNLLILDEVLVGRLDPTNTEIVINMIEQMGYAGTNIFAIAHGDSVPGNFRGQMRFEKQGNFSVLL